MKLKTYLIRAAIIVVFLLGFQACKSDDAAGLALPEVESLDIKEITSSSAKLDAFVSGEGIMLKGGVWSLDESNLDLTANIADSELEGEEFAIVFTNLEPSTTYYVRAFAINLAGVSYGDARFFTTKSE